MPSKPQRVDEAMGGEFRRSYKRMERKLRSGEFFIGSDPEAMVRLVEQAYVSNSTADLQNAIDEMMIVAGVVNRDLGLERNTFLNDLERSVTASGTIPSMLRDGFMGKLREAVEELVVEGREGASKRARTRHAKALTPMLTAIGAEPDLRRRAILPKDRAERLVAGSVRKRGETDRERHADLAPYFVGAVADDELRYYLSVAIDDDTKRRSEEVISNLEAKEAEGAPAFVPVICIGTGVYGQVVANELMAELPDVMERDVLFLDANEHLGGQFAVGTRSVFKVNNRVRPEEPDSLARPGTPDNIMPLGDHAVIDLPAVSAQTYPSQNLLGAALKTNTYLNMHQGVTGARVVGITKTTEPGNGKYSVEFVRNNRLYKVNTEIIMVADGIGEQRPGFTDGFDVATRELIAESRQATEREAVQRYYTFQDFVKLAAREESGNWREKLSGEGVVIGAGDSGIVTVAACLGYGPDDVGSTQLDFTERITWVGQAALNAKLWCDTARPRYVDLAREFPRESKGEAALLGQEVKPKQVFITQRRTLLEPIRIAYEALLQSDTAANLRRYDEAVEEAKTADPSFPLSAPMLGAVGPQMSKIGLDFTKAQALIEAGEASAQGIIESELAAVDSLITSLTNLGIRLNAPVSNGTFIDALREFARGQEDRNLNVPDATFRQPLAIFGKTLFPDSFLPSSNNWDIYFQQGFLRESPNYRGGDLTGGFPETDRVLFKRRIESVVKLLIRERDSRRKQLDEAEGKVTPGEQAEITTEGQPTPEGGNGYSRIVPIAAKAARAEKFVDANGKERVRVFTEDGQVVEADWIIDASGVTSRTNELFRDFADGSAREREVGEADVSTFDLLFETQGYQFTFPSRIPNPFLKGLTVRVSRAESKPDGRAISIVRVNTIKGQEFELEFIKRQEVIRVIAGSGDYDSAQIARALEDWLRVEQESAGAEFMVDEKIIGGTVPDIFGRKETDVLRVRDVTIADRDALIPVASQLFSGQQAENIYFLGPTNKFPLSNEERATIPALSKVMANLASMFRYVGPTGKFVSEVLTKLIESLGLGGTRQITVSDRQERAPWRDELLEGIVELEVAFSEAGRVIPNIANPKVILSYLVRAATLERLKQPSPEETEVSRDLRLLSELPPFLEFKLDRNVKDKVFTLTASTTSEPALRLWNTLANDDRFTQAIVTAAKVRGSGATYRINTRTGQLSKKSE